MTGSDRQQVTIKQAIKEVADFPETKGLVPSFIVWPRESSLHARRFVICRLGATNQ